MITVLAEHHLVGEEIVPAVAVLHVAGQIGAGRGVEAPEAAGVVVAADLVVTGQSTPCALLRVTDGLPSYAPTAM